MTDEPAADSTVNDLPLFYVNFVQMSIGPFDVTMDFGYQSPQYRAAANEAVTSGAEPEPVQPTVRLAMSHSHAKSMIPIIAGLVANLESNVGTIPTPGFEDTSKE